MAWEPSRRNLIIITVIVAILVVAMMFSKKNKKKNKKKGVKESFVDEIHRNDDSGVFSLFNFNSGDVEGYNESNEIVENFPQATPMNVIYTDTNGNLSNTSDLGLQNLTVNSDAIFRSNISVGNDVVLEGDNKWILHTPNDGRTTMYIAPIKSDKTDWNWETGTEFLNNGNVRVKGALSTNSISTGVLSAGSISAGGALSADSISATKKISTDGDLSADSISTRTLTTGSISAAGALSAGSSISTGGALSAGSISTTGKISAGSISTGGALSAGSISTGGALSASSIKIGNLTLLDAGDGTLRISNDNGYVDIGAKNKEWAHIYTDRPKFAFDKQITDVSVTPYNDYLKTGQDVHIQGRNGNLDNYNGKCNDGDRDRDIGVQCSGGHGGDNIKWKLHKI